MGNATPGLVVLVYKQASWVCHGEQASKHPFLQFLPQVPNLTSLHGGRTKMKQTLLLPKLLLDVVFITEIENQHRQVAGAVSHLQCL